MDIVEKQQIPSLDRAPQAKLNGEDKAINGHHHVAPAAPNQTKKSILESKKANEFAVVYFIKNNQGSKPQAKSLLIHSINQGSLDFIGNDPQIFRRFVKAQAAMVAFEFKTERDQKRFEEKHWVKLQTAFHERLKSLELQRQKNHSS